MDVTAGACRVQQAGQSDWTTYGTGEYFEVPGKSGFEIAVDDGVMEYVCSFQ
jgi:hypothetical protein